MLIYIYIVITILEMLPSVHARLGGSGGLRP